MLRIDFGQTFLDHRSILVLVKKLGSIKEDEFSQLFEDISQLRTVELPNSRTVHLRYTRHISHQFIDWGSFHMHKKLLGILSIARCSPDKDLASIKTAHESLKTWYSNTSLDSRCFLLGYGKINEEEMKKQMREFVFLNDDNLMEEVERQVADYAMSLYLVLESKRMEKSLEKPDKMILLRSPLDNDAPFDAENRNRKQCIGRMKKYIGDLCLVAGLPQEAVFHYSVAIDFLRSIGDALWLSGSYEGLCAASLLCRSSNRTSSLERPSLQLNVNQLSTAGPVNGVDGDEVRIGSAIPLTDEEIVEKSDEIFQVYGRYKDSKVLGVEARFKYARFFIVKKMYKEASNALQDVLSTELALSDAEKIQQYSAMSIMYEDIGFTRKAAFFTRMAALHCTSQHLPLQGWTASYNLLRNALEGYSIHFDKQVEEGRTEGWPELQIKLMRELIKMSEELQSPEIPIRHISYLLHAMYKRMRESTILELITLLESLSSRQKQCSLVGNVVLANGDMLPPVSWTDLPIVRKLKVNILASHLRPFARPASPIKTPFIFSTLNKKPRHKKQSPTVNWVEGEVGEVAMQVCNPMPFDIKVSKMTLLTEGVEFQAFPSCLALSNDAMSHPFMLLGIPESPGQLRITGYSVEVFGIQSNCPLTQIILDNPLDVPLLVNVTPRLPLVQFQSSIPNIKSSVNSSHRGSSLFLEVIVYTGQTISGAIIVENVGQIAVENITITVLSTFKTGHTNIIELQQDLASTLPLQPNTTSHFNLVFNGLLGPNDGDNFAWTGKLKVTYSGGAAWVKGMSRQAAIDIKVEVLRSLQCSIVEIAPLESDEQHFEILMDVQNQTTKDIEWRYEVNQEATSSNETPSILPANVKTRACVILEKLDLSGIENERPDRCSERLSELVKLHWKIPDLEVSGMFNIEGFQLNEDTINILRKYSLTFEIRLNGLKVGRDEEITTQASSPVMLTVQATNCTDCEVKPTILTIEPFELSEDGTQVFDVKSKICWLGSTSTLLPKIAVGGSAVHTCGFLFLCPGQYYINVRCFERTTVDHSLFRDRAHVIKTSSPSNIRTRNSRSESFTDNLLLRQRSFSTPLAMLAHSAVIRVIDDTNTGEDTSKDTVEDTSTDDTSTDTGEDTSRATLEDTSRATLEDTSTVREDTSTLTGKDTSTLTGKDTSRDTGEDTSTLTGENTSRATLEDTSIVREDTSIVREDTSTVREDTGRDTGEDTSKDTGEDTSTVREDTSRDTGEDTSKDKGEDTSRETEESVCNFQGKNLCRNQEVCKETTDTSKHNVDGHVVETCEVDLDLNDVVELPLHDGVVDSQNVETLDESHIGLTVDYSINDQCRVQDNVQGIKNITNISEPCQTSIDGNIRQCLNGQTAEELLTNEDKKIHNETNNINPETIQELNDEIQSREVLHHDGISEEGTIDEEIVQSPSIQERIMFFSSNKD